MTDNLPAILNPGLPEPAPIGVHHDVAAERYHADAFGRTPTLSSSIAKLLYMKTPAHAWTVHPRLNAAEHEQEDEPKFDLGSAAHEMILGRGAGIDVHDFADWKTKAAKEARVASRAARQTPMLKHQYERARQIMDAALAHPHAPYDHGHAETVLVWRDIGGPLCRAMLDHWDGGAVITDLKITDVPLTDESLARQVGSMGYDISAGFYARGLAALHPATAGRIRFRWHFVEASAPYGSRIVEATKDMLSIGDRKAALAIAIWRRCLATGDWPCWSKETGSVPLPWRYIEKAMEAEMDHPDAMAAVFSDSIPAYEPKRLVEPDSAAAEGGVTPLATSFGTRGSEVRILSLRPIKLNLSDQMAT